MAKNEKEQATKKDLSESSQSLVICSHGSFAARPFAYTIGSTCYQCYPQSTQEFVSIAMWYCYYKKTVTKNAIRFESFFPDILSGSKKKKKRTDRAAPSGSREDSQETLL
jgi:hypothetical protein